MLLSRFSCYQYVAVLWNFDLKSWMKHNQPAVQMFSLSVQFALESTMLKLPKERRRWGESKGAGRGPHTYRNGYYFYSPQSSTVIKSKMTTTRILPTQTRFRPAKIHLHCRLKRSQKLCLHAWKQTSGFMHFWSQN